MEQQSLFLCLQPVHAHDAGKHIPGPVGYRCHIQLSRLDLGHIQDIVDGMQKHLAGILDVRSILRHLIGDVFPQDHFIQTDNGIDGRPDLMAHTGEEPVLGRTHFLDLPLLLFGFFDQVRMHLAHEPEHHDDQGSHHEKGRPHIHVLTGSGMGALQGRMGIGHDKAEQAHCNIGDQQEPHIRT